MNATSDFPTRLLTAGSRTGIGLVALTLTAAGTGDFAAVVTVVAVAVVAAMGVCAVAAGLLTAAEDFVVGAGAGAELAGIVAVAVAVDRDASALGAAGLAATRVLEIKIAASPAMIANNNTIINTALIRFRRVGELSFLLP